MLWIGHDAGQQREEMAGHALDCRRLEKIRAVFHCRSGLALQFNDIQRKIVLRHAALDLLLGHLQARKGGDGQRPVLQHEHHLEYRCAAQVTAGLQLGHQLLEG